MDLQFLQKLHARLIKDVDEKFDRLGIRHPEVMTSQELADGVQAMIQQCGDAAVLGRAEFSPEMRQLRGMQQASQDRHNPLITTLAWVGADEAAEWPEGITILIHRPTRESTHNGYLDFDPYWRPDLAPITATGALTLFCRLDIALLVLKEQTNAMKPQLPVKASP